MNPEEMAQMITAWITEYSAAGEPGTEGYEEVPPPEIPEDTTPDDYRAAMEMVFDEYDVPEEMRQGVYDQLDANGDYSSAGYIENLTIVVEDDDITQHIDNSITVEEGAEVRNIHQANDTNLANATGDGAIAGDEQYGDFQTGDGVQVGDGNSGVVNQGDNSGVQGGQTAEADDVTTGDGNFNNEGSIDDSAVAFGGGDATNEANYTEDHSTNDSFNTTDAHNTDYSNNVTDSNNYTSTEEATYDVDADVKLEGYGEEQHGYEEPAEEPYALSRSPTTPRSKSTALPKTRVTPPKSPSTSRAERHSRYVTIEQQMAGPRYHRGPFAL